MRMFSLASWISESRGCDKTANGEAAPLLAKAVAIDAMENRPAPAPANMKRKRDGESDSSADSDLKRSKAVPPTASNNIDSQQPAPTSRSADVVADFALSAERARNAIEAQFNLEILLKHDELRLINQELAKCQTALEQLRRCHLIPYPTSQQTPSAMLQVSSGTGAALEPRAGEVKPQWAPAYGVTDGPYTRHYAKWLIPDPRFDGQEPEWATSHDGTAVGRVVGEGRTTRNSVADPSSTGKSRSQRGSVSHKLQALPSGYPQAKAQVGPPTLKRADGQLVKLVCVDCQRENFASIQGFINHCRIAHKRDFKSHEEAAVHCGHPIELDEAGGIKGEEKASAPATSVPNGLVHPLIRSVPTEPNAYRSLLSRIEASMELFRKGELPGVTSIPSSTASSPPTDPSTQSPHSNFVPSNTLPHLSKLLANRGFDRNLDEMVGEARKAVNLELDEPPEEDSEGELVDLGRQTDGAADGPPSPVTTVRMPARSILPSDARRPNSSKGFDGGANNRKSGVNGFSPRFSFAPINTGAAGKHNKPNAEVSNGVDPRERHGDDDVIMMDADAIVDLSPHTVASNNAPSLVSDDGEYDEGDDVESEAPSSEAEDDDSVHEIDIEELDGEDKVVPREGLRRGSAAERSSSMKLRKEGKQVTFVSPVKEGKKNEKRRH